MCLNLLFGDLKLEVIDQSITTVAMYILKNECNSYLLKYIYLQLRVLYY